MFYDSPLGRLRLESDGEAMTALSFDGECQADAVEADRQDRLPVFEETCRWLDLYFSGRVPDFIPALNLQGSAFRQSVWKILLEIPYGATTTYGEIAAHLVRGTPGRMSAQAVGGAVGHNPVAIIVPCHRVIGADGSLTGYASGLSRKSWLLHHEGVGDVDAERSVAAGVAAGFHIVYPNDCLPVHSSEMPIMPEASKNKSLH